ncbi:MAG: 30S ribosomal protein S2 [Candidatus Dependentiae bacterium]|nr:30S ribosomal protein S2 [Candidatus Dependentiae bacterium]
MIDLQKLIQAGVQFGHQTWRWSPRMRQYIWGKKNGVHLIDVSKTAAQLEKASAFLEETVAEGKQVLWVGTKKAAQAIIDEAANRLNEPRATHRWVGGTLTNYPQVKKSVTKLLHFEDVVDKADKSVYTKKEIGSFQKVIARLQKSVGGVRQLAWPVGALIVIDAKKETTAIKEANVMGIPVIALVDTNSDPSGVSIVIPGNDDVARSIRVIVDELAAAVERGLAKASERKAAVPAETEQTTEESAVEQVFGQEATEAEGEEEEEHATRRAPRSRRADRGAEGLVVPNQRPSGPRFGGRQRQSWQRPEAPVEGQAPAPQRGYGPRPEGQRHEGPRPDGQRTEGYRPRGPRPEGSRPYGPRPDGQRSEGSRPYGPRPEGSRPYGPRPEGSRPYGSRPEGSRSYGPRPEGSRPYGPRPEGPRPEGSRPYGPRPEGSRPYGPRPEGSRPHGPRPEGYRPRPYGPRPEGSHAGDRRPGEGRPEGHRSDRPYTPRSDRPFGPRRDGEHRSGGGSYHERRHGPAGSTEGAQRHEQRAPQAGQEGAQKAEPGNGSEPAKPSQE